MNKWETVTLRFDCFKELVIPGMTHKVHMPILDTTSPYAANILIIYRPHRGELAIATQIPSHQAAEVISLLPLRPKTVIGDFVTS